ncbi:hypothetical protein B0H13DRAFT_2678873 [Mycena leptocephala]|nr:hypothetical protein B0H13DRAFT_2678873 [Mycena leptocephala]
MWQLILFTDLHSTFLSLDVLLADSVVLKIWAICTSILNPRPTHPIQVDLRCRGRFLLTSPRSDLGYIFLYIFLY